MTQLRSSTMIMIESQPRDCSPSSEPAVRAAWGTAQATQAPRLFACAAGSAAAGSASASASRCDFSRRGTCGAELHSCLARWVKPEVRWRAAPQRAETRGSRGTTACVRGLYRRPHVRGVWWWWRQEEGSRVLVTAAKASPGGGVWATRVRVWVCVRERSRLVQRRARSVQVAASLSLTCLSYLGARRRSTAGIRSG
jgi:hypothetical protein